MTNKIFPTDTSLVTTAGDDLIIGGDTSNPGEGFVEHTALGIAQTVIDDSSTATTKVWSASKSNSHTANGTVTFTNKTINADNNTITNLELDNFKIGVLDTDLSSVSASDDTIPSSKATKTYADTKVSLAGNETIPGIKTFSSFPITPSSAPTTDYQVANRKYVNDNLGGYSINSSSVNTYTTTDITHTLGVTPKLVTIHAGVDGASVTSGSFSNGFYDGTNYVCNTYLGTAFELSTAFVVKACDSSSSYYTGTITTMNSTKITITWAITGTPSITAIKIIAKFEL